ncbi:hypothetical protein [Nonomuraea dietziae]|uniref:hypothetical protein n=1 Tax=Nonomuraea dietziae TaxID=65515 RepID=UPI0031D7DB6A
MAGQEERPFTLACRSLLIATGAHDRPLPFPGMGPARRAHGGRRAGPAQGRGRAGRAAGRRLGRRAPSCCPSPRGLAKARGLGAGVFEANGPLGLARHPLLAAGKAGEALGLRRAALAGHRVPYRTRHAVVAAHGSSRVTHVTVARLDAEWRVLSSRTVECDGPSRSATRFVPQIDLAVQLAAPPRTRPTAAPS